MPGNCGKIGLADARPEGQPGHAYTFRVRAADRMGNLSPYVVSERVEVARAAPTPPPPAGAGSVPPGGQGQPSSPASPLLRVAAPRRSGARIVLSGTIA